MDLPSGAFFGIGVGVVALAALGGIGLGMLTGRLVTLRRWRGDLTARWNQWMRYSIACQRIEEVARRARGRPATTGTGLQVTIWTVVVFATILLLLATVVDGVPAIDKTPVFVGYGIYLGHGIGRTIAVKVWVRSFLASVDDMIRRGEIALWGVV